MKICVIGSGYVGLVTGACLADFGMNVIGVDKDPEIVDALNNHRIPIFEPGLEDLVKRNMEVGRLSFTSEHAPAIRDSLAVFIAVGTPPTEGGEADLSAIREVARSIGENLDSYKVIITKSTVPTGTGRRIESLIRETCTGEQDFAVVSNPEFLREGSAIEDFMRPDRVVIGTSDARARRIMSDLYSPLAIAEHRYVFTDVATAELIKYASNAFLATKISFINEVANLCEATGADVAKVSFAMGLDHRIGPHFLRPGPGFGGSCFPKDSGAVVKIAEKHGQRFRIMEAVIDVNKVTKARMVDKIADAFGGLEKRRIGLLGLSFKPETDDVRESPALEVVHGLLAGGASIRAYDPEASTKFEEELDAEARGRLEYCGDAFEAAAGMDGLVIATEWNEFKHLELPRLREALRRPLIVDLRNIYDPDRMRQAGFDYISVGRTPVLAAGKEVGA